MEDILKVIILSLIEGVTEFLPISSTGHLIVGTALLDFNEMGAVFEIFIQFGAVLAVIFYYRASLRDHVTGFRSDAEIRRFWTLIVLASLPAAALGFLFDEGIETVFFSPVVVALALIAGGIIFLLVERLPRFRERSNEQASPITQVTTSQAIVVGIVQMLALIPGMSRSGTTIVGGMLAGMDRRLATEFSFFLAIPVLGGATLYKLLISLDRLQADELALLFLGAVLSGLFAWFAIDWLLKFISRNSFVLFGYYRIVGWFAHIGGHCQRTDLLIQRRHDAPAIHPIGKSKPAWIFDCPKHGPEYNES